MTPGKTLLFLHIPKTAGSTLRYILRNNYGRSDIFHFHNELFPNLSVFLLNHMSKYRSYRLVIGHFGYGLHKHIHQDYQYFTMLRNPVRRVISNYYHIRRKKDHSLNRLVLKMTLEAYIQSPISAGAHNHQTRMLASPAGYFGKNSAKDSPVSPSTLAIAKENLSSFAAFGLTERFEESLILYRKTFGWENINYRIQNVTSKRDEKIPEPLLKLITEKNPFDLELYSFATQLFEQRIAAYSGDFQTELQEFRLSNQTINK